MKLIVTTYILSPMLPASRNAIPRHHSNKPT